VDWDTLSVEVNHAPAPRGSVRVLGDRVTLTLAGLDVPNRYTVVATVRDNAGAVSDPFYAPLWLEQEAFSWKDAVLYFAFTDRFHDGDPSNNDPTEGVEALANWSGGDFKGIQDKIEAGYFDELGVNALWISAPNDNPNRRDSGADGRGYAAYHGYFPSSWTEPEDHFGDVEDLRAMVAAAHRRGIRVLIDWVGNHVHDEHPWRRDNPDWFNGPGLCRDNDGWNQRPETCWFEPYLPDLRYEVPGVTEAVADAGAWWVQETDLDGFRVDAVKHMPHNFGYTLRARIDPLFKHSNTPFYMVGETFVGDWNVGNGNLLKAYVRPGELDGQFDFPLYWELLKVIGRREGNFRDLERVVAASENFYGPSAIMSSFLGNHDVPRFVSHAWQPPFDLWGNGGRDIGWDPNRRPGQPSEAEPYKRLEQAFAFLMTMPEVPLIYYGDEVGLAGAGDPDNRRVMPAEGALNVHQRALRERVGLLGALRRESGALRRGTRATLATEDGWYAYQRRLGQEAVVVVLSRDGGSFTVRPSAPINNGDVLRDAITGNTFTVQGGGVTLQLPANGAAVLVK
jgi:glycosidase